MLFLVAAVNVAIFGAGLYFLTGVLAAERESLKRESSELLDYFLSSGTITPMGDLKVLQILRWPHWEKVADAMIVSNVQEDSDGHARPRGVFLNPVGSVRRAPDFDMEGILRSAARSIATQGRVEGPIGTCVPVRDDLGAVWGACWFLLDTGVDLEAVWMQLLPWFGVSTLLLILGTFWVLRRFVLDPVRVLAEGSQRVRAGDLSVRLPEPGHHDELTDLVHGFNEMTAQVQVFHGRLEEEVASAREQARAIEAAAIRQKQLAAMGELAAGIAHEINNPLGGLLNAVDALGRAGLPQERRGRYLHLLQEGLERIQGTVMKLLRFTPREAVRQPLALADPVNDAVALASHRAEKQGVEFEVQADPSIVIDGVRGELGQAVLNLLINALDALDGRNNGGHVSVTVARRGSLARLAVEDDGPGVAPQDLERVADLFYTTKEVGKGTGLGLALVLDVVRRHDGHVHFASEPGRGFRVEILLPLRVDERAAGRPR